MGVQFERLTYASENSLTLIIDDLMRQRAQGPAKAAAVDMESWLNALQRQSRPLLQSETGRASLEAWLDLVEQESPASGI